MNLSDQQHLISAARGDIPADLLLKNARIINVFTGEVEEGNIAISGQYIAGIGNYTDAESSIDAEGCWVAPGFINGHIHPESSMLDIPQYARAVVPHGTSAIVTDLHEIANVAGREGIEYILDCAKLLPLDLFLMAPSCVPATPLETSGAALGEQEIADILKMEQCIGLGEMMNYPGVIFGDESVLGKIRATGKKRIDGHAPGLRGKDLSAYLTAGIHSDHESVALDEAREKLRLGMTIMIREGSSEKNLEALLPLVTDKTYKRCIFVVDDRTCSDLLHDGDIDAVVRKAIKLGLEPVRAIQMASINTAEYFGLRRMGALAPGYYANMVMITDLSSLKVDRVFYRGTPVAAQGKPLFAADRCCEATLSGSFHLKPLSVESLRLTSDRPEVPVIEIIPGQIVTRRSSETIKVQDGVAKPDIARDIIKAVVAERHHGTGNVGVGMVKGFGLKRGAIASSIAHDSHNIVAVGASDEDILAAVREIERLQGGLVVVVDGAVKASLALPVAGLLSPEPLEMVVTAFEQLQEAAKQAGVSVHSPFAVLSFLALPVIPELRLTDKGLVDVTTFSFIC